MDVASINEPQRLFASCFRQLVNDNFWKEAYGSNLLVLIE